MDILFPSLFAREYLDSHLARVWEYTTIAIPKLLSKLIPAMG